jgi:hypothetical protein
MARDCDKPRDVSTVTCRNCDQGEWSRTQKSRKEVSDKVYSWSLQPRLHREKELGQSEVQQLRRKWVYLYGILQW